MLSTGRVYDKCPYNCLLYGHFLYHEAKKKIINVMKDKDGTILVPGDNVTFIENGTLLNGIIKYNSDTDMTYITVDNHFHSLYTINFETLSKTIL